MFRIELIAYIWHVAMKLVAQRYREASSRFLGIDAPGVAIHVLCLIDGLVFVIKFIY